MPDIKNLISLDIETKSPDPTQSDWALDAHRGEITVISTYGNGEGKILPLHETLLKFHAPIVTHGGKFDFKFLIAKGYSLTPDDYAHDTMNMAAAFPHKIPLDWLAQYETQRKKKNEELGKAVHRPAGKFSLKSLAPYFLGVEPFWETEDHSNIEYALKDSKYTYDLAQFFLRELGDHLPFYYKLQDWARMLLRAEIAGITMDYEHLEIHEKATAIAEVEAEKGLKVEWKEYFDLHLQREASIVEAKYQLMASKSLAKAETAKPTKQYPTIEVRKAHIQSKYMEMCKKAQTKVEPLNLGSHVQLKWLLKEAMGVDVSTFDGEDESTGKAVLERLKSEGVKGVETFMSWRQAYKLNTSFFPSYRENAVRGRVSTNYNITGTRTGRLSSSNVNLQQISKRIMDIFCAAAGKSLVYRDVSAIEPRLLAYETECPNLCKIFVDGSDFHSFNVRVMLGIEEDDKTIKTKYSKERDLIKEVGLSLLYGAGWRRVQESSAKRGFRFNDYKCKTMTYGLRDAYPRIFEYKEYLEHQIRSGEVITNILGRPLYYEDHYLHTKSLNTKIQAGASDLLLASVYKATQMAAERNMEFTPLLFIHDAAAIEVKSEEAQAAYDLLGEAIASWDMQTIWGKIPLLSEGGIYQNLPSKG